MLTTSFNPVYSGLEFSLPMNPPKYLVKTLNYSSPGLGVAYSERTQHKFSIENAPQLKEVLPVVKTPRNMSSQKL